MPTNRSKIPSKLAQIKEILQATRNFDPVDASPAQVEKYMLAKHPSNIAPHPIIVSTTAIQGMVQGYFILIHPTAGYVACKINKRGFVYTKVWIAPTLQEIIQEILHTIAWGASQRVGNVGVWQRQLPEHLRPFAYSGTYTASS